MSLGTAFHATVAVNFRQKISTHRDLAMEEIRPRFDEEFAMAIADAELRDDEDAADLAAMGDAMLSVYLPEAAPSIQPTAVEMEVQGESAGVKVYGFNDLLDTAGRIIDCKTAARRPTGMLTQHSLQLTTYAMITHGATGACRLETLVENWRTQQLSPDAAK
jgi:hypothetical protein